jgi:hypothetical protein
VTQIRHVYIFVTTAVPLVLELCGIVLQTVVSKVVSPLSARTQPWRHRINGKCIKPLKTGLDVIRRTFGKCIKPFEPGLDVVGRIFKHVVAVVFWILSVLFDVFLWVLKWTTTNKYTRPVLSFLKSIGRCLWELLICLARGLWFVLWWPFWWMGYKLHGDPDWDWILLWNLTIPFPYLFPSIFGELVARPRTDYERAIFVPPSFERDLEIHEGPSYDEWNARVMPDNLGPFLNAECWLDAPLESEGDVQVTCMLVLRRFQIYGLLLQPAQEGKRQYRRVGMFKASKFESCFAWTEDAMQTITLI